MGTEDIHRDSEGRFWIEVRHNWQAREGLKAPKADSFGAVTLPATVGALLLHISAAKPTTKCYHNDSRKTFYFSI